MIKYETLNPKTTDKEENFLHGLLQAQGIMVDYKTFNFLLYVKKIINTSNFFLFFKLFSFFPIIK